MIRRLVALATAAALALGVAAPAALAVDNLTITTDYPAIVVAPGAKVSFNIDVATPEAARVALTLTGAPDAWNAKIHGGGFVIDAVETNGTDPTAIRVDLTNPGGFQDNDHDAIRPRGAATPGDPRRPDSLDAIVRKLPSTPPDTRRSASPAK
jgi:hypothetical protein